MSSYLSNFVSRVLNLFKKEGASRKDGSTCPVPLRRCNSVIENRRIKEVIASRMPADDDVWKTKTSQLTAATSREVQSSGDGDTEARHTPEARRRLEGKNGPSKECSYCKGDMQDLQHSLAFCRRDIPSALGGGGDPHAPLRRSRSVDGRDAFVGGRSSEWHDKFNSLRTADQDSTKESKLSFEPGEGFLRPRKSIFSMVNSSGNRRRPNTRTTKSRIPILFQTKTPDLAYSEPPNFRFVNCRQRAPNNVAHRSRANAAFESMFGEKCGVKYGGKVIDCARHRKWMREAGVGMDRDGRRFKMCAKSKITLNMQEYKCALKRMCDEVGSDYWHLLEQMTSFNEAGSTSTKSGLAVSF